MTSVPTEAELTELIERAETDLAWTRLHARIDHINILVADLRAVVIDIVS